MISTSELQRRLTGGEPPVLVHVLPEDAFREARIPASLNLCVYETAFLDKAGDRIPDRATPVVVYSLDGSGEEADEARRQLLAAGYLAVEVLEGGLAAWQAAGGVVEGDAPEPQSAPDGRFVADLEQSVIRWTGRNLFNHHHGTVRLASGSAVLARGSVVSARFAVDLHSIRCEDIADAGANASLLAHLASGDFFCTGEHPRAEFVAHVVEGIAGATPGCPNYRVAGDFTLRGVTAPLDFPAVVALAPDGSISVQAEFAIDRTRWGSRYGSGRFFNRLGRHVVNDHIGLHLKIRLLPEG